MILQWFELIIRIIKVIILSTIYSTLIYISLVLVLKRTKNNWLERRMNRKVRNWVLIHFLISLGLFLFSFSYWQDTGLGEAPQLPIGYGQVIYSPDFVSTNFFPDLEKTELNKDELVIKNFIVSNNILCAEVSHEFSNSPKFDFIVCDLQRKTNQTFLTENDYNKFAKSKGLPLVSEFYDFKTHYTEFYENKTILEKWLLP